MSGDPLHYRTVRANGLDFEVATAGHGDRLAVLLHGFPELAFSWRHQFGPLVDAGYTVWAPNQRGYGNSSRPEGVAAYHIDRLVEDVVALVDAAGFERCTLVGHDWGAAVAWHLAMHRPEILDRLVIMNVPHPACMQRELRRFRQLRRSWYVLFFQLPWLPEKLLTAKQGRAMIGTFRESAVHPERFGDDVIDVYREAVCRPGAATAMVNWYRAALRSRRAQQGEMPLIDVPTLMIWGKQDVALTIQTTEGTDEYVSDLILHLLPDASHWVQQDAPEEVNRILCDWLREEVELAG